MRVKESLNQRMDQTRKNERKNIEDAKRTKTDKKDKL